MSGEDGRRNGNGKGFDFLGFLRDEAKFQARTTSAIETLGKVCDDLKIKMEKLCDEMVVLGKQVAESRGGARVWVVVATAIASALAGALIARFVVPLVLGG